MNIQKMFPTEVYQRGLAYFNNDQVSDLLFDINNEVWTATVQGTKEYFVEVNLKDIEKGSISAYCDCPAFSKNDSCKHIVAVLLIVFYKSEEKARDLDYTSYNNIIIARYSIHNLCISLIC